MEINMEQIGVIVSTNGDTARVQFKRASACGENCGMCGGCEKLNSFVDAKNIIGAKTGDTVKLETKTSYVLTGAFFVYVFPLVLALVAYGLLGWFYAVAAFVLPFVVLRIINERLEKYYRPKIVKILGNAQ